MADLNSFISSLEEARHTAYTKPCQLPINVAFEVLKWEVVASTFDKKDTPRPLLNSDGYVDLLLYPGAKFLVSSSKTAKINSSIGSGSKFYLLQEVGPRRIKCL